MLLHKVSTQILYIFIIILNLSCFNCIEPLTIGAAIGVGSLAFGFFKDNTLCRYYECCDSRQIIHNIAALKNTMDTMVFGQHIVNEHIVTAIAAHVSIGSKSRKPLVISLHGTPGTGKNFVSELIANALYKDGAKSKFVHKYLGRADFPRADLTHQYTERINNEVRAAIKACPDSLFIFDEVDKMPSGVFETLTSLVDYNAFADGTDNSKAIFIFLSNTAGVHISNALIKHMKAGKLREDTRLKDFEPLLKTAAYNLDGGFKRTSLIEAHVIDHYLPFLPLEKSHIVKCLEAEYARWNQKPNRKQIDEIIENSVVFDRENEMFAVAGCKTLEKKVALAVHSTSP